jgi:hypothetical protein
MRSLRRLFRPVLALLLLAASGPSWACARACDGGAVSLACVSLCQRSQALLSHNGKLATLGADRCEVRVSAAPSATLTAAFELAAPAPAFGLATAAMPAAPVAPAFAAAATRGPPSFASVLLSTTPRTNAPPFFV